MPPRNWKRFRANNLRDAMRACKDYAQEKHQLSVARIAELMGDVSEDSLYGWLSKGRMPVALVPTFELVCGAHFVSDWLAASAGRMVIAMPRAANPARPSCIRSPRAAPPLCASWRRSMPTPPRWTRPS